MWNLDKTHQKVSNRKQKKSISGPLHLHERSKIEERQNILKIQQDPKRDNLIDEGKRVKKCNKNECNGRRHSLINEINLHICRLNNSIIKITLTRILSKLRQS